MMSEWEESDEWEDEEREGYDEERGDTMSEW
jgi:hypothetical protein